MKDGLEYIILRVKGQSFMLHQIRKMIGLIVAYIRGFAGKDTFVKSWSHDRIDIPKAPGVGLVLDHVHYERYNKRYGSDGMHQSLTWDEVNDQVEEFCQRFIYPVITQSENEEKSMFNWLATLPYHTYDVREQKANAPLNSISLSPIGAAAVKAEVANEAVAAIGDSSDGESDDEDEDGPKAKRIRSIKSLG
jgi:tRNA pseudouridine38-40 synthase